MIASTRDLRTVLAVGDFVVENRISYRPRKNERSRVKYVLKYERCIRLLSRIAVHFSEISRYRASKDIYSKSTSPRRAIKLGLRNMHSTAATRVRIVFGIRHRNCPFINTASRCRSARRRKPALDWHAISGVISWSESSDSIFLSLSLSFSPRSRRSRRDRRKGRGALPCIHSQSKHNSMQIMRNDSVYDLSDDDRKRSEDSDPTATLRSCISFCYLNF